MQLQKIINSLRQFRVWHRYLGLSLAAILIISAITGIALAWKKDVAIIQPPTSKGVSKSLDTWIPINEIATIALDTFTKVQPIAAAEGIDRMDVRPSKGIVKVLMNAGYWEVQVDGTSGAVYSIAKRHSDWIEHLHDGSIVSDLFKLLSMNVLGVGLLLMIVTGWWLWYGPKRVREKRKM